MFTRFPCCQTRISWLDGASVKVTFKVNKHKTCCTCDLTLIMLSGADPKEDADPTRNNPNESLTAVKRRLWCHSNRRNKFTVNPFYEDIILSVFCHDPL